MPYSNFIPIAMEFKKERDNKLREKKWNQQNEKNGKKHGKNADFFLYFLENFLLT